MVCLLRSGGANSVRSYLQGTTLLSVSTGDVGHRSFDVGGIPSTPLLVWPHNGSILLWYDDYRAQQGIRMQAWKVGLM